MTYEVSFEIAASAWIGIMGTFLLMTRWLRGKMSSLFGNYVDRVDQKNGDLGLDRSVDAGDIARDYLVPIGGGAIDAYTGRNDYPRERYMSELNRDVGRPMTFGIFAIVFVLTTFIAFSGPLVYYLWGTAYVAEYLVALYTLVGVNLVFYFLF